MQCTIIGPKALLRPTLPGDTPNPLWDDILRLCGIWGLTPERLGDDARISGITDDSEFTLEHVAGAVQLGAEVYGYPVWLEMTDEEYAGDVPIGIPNGMDEENESIPWSEWHDSTHQHTVIDGKHYVPGNSFGEELTGSTILALITAGYTVKTKAEYDAIRAAAEA